MGRRGTKAHGCSYPGCENSVTHDLILFKRVGANRMIKSDTGKYSIYKAQSKEVVHHMYLCNQHMIAMYDFMEAYEGR